MALTVKMDNPAYPKGEELDVTGIGLVENGSSVKLDEEAEQRFFAANGMTVREALKDSEIFEVSGTAEYSAPAVPAEEEEEEEGGEEE